MFVCTWASAESSVWKVQKGKSVIYLGGTCHLLRETDYPLPSEFDKAYKASEILVCETDIGKLLDPTTQQELMTKAVYADGSTIDKHLSAQAYSELSAYCESNSIPITELKQFKPLIFMVTLEVMELMKLGVTAQGVDLFFYQQAMKDKKAVEGLETVEEQINFMVSMGNGGENEFVTHSIRDMKTLKQQLENLVNAWRKGDAEKLNELINTKFKVEAPKIYKKLLADRNSNWLPLIDAYLNTPQIEFFLVGGGHLVGPDGIIVALNKKGYKVDKL
jgi:hypothetical protein